MTLKIVVPALLAALGLAILIFPALFAWEDLAVLAFMVLAASAVAGLLLRRGGSGGVRTLGSLLLIVGIATPLMVAGFIGAIVVLNTPVPPTKSLVPEIVDVVLRWDWVEGECQVQRLTLESGRTLDLRLMGDSRARCGDGPWVTGVPRISGSFDLSGTAQAGETVRNGGLLYYGHDGQAEWIAGASSNELAGDADECPYTIRGSGYDQGDILHFSTGLVIKKTADFENLTPWRQERSIFRDSDKICVNRQGDAVSIWRWAPY